MYTHVAVYLKGAGPSWLHTNLYRRPGHGLIPSRRACFESAAPTNPLGGQSGCQFSRPDGYSDPASYARHLKEKEVTLAGSKYENISGIRVRNGAGI